MAQRSQMSKYNPVAEKKGRWEAFIRFLDDGRLCLTNNAAERPCAVALWKERSGYSPVLSVAESVPPSCIPDRHSQDERHRSAGLAGGCPRPHAQHAIITAAGAVALELVHRKRPADGSLMARPTHVYTLDYVATLIGENLELLQEVRSWRSQRTVRLRRRFDRRT